MANEVKRRYEGSEIFARGPIIDIAVAKLALRELCFAKIPCALKIVQFPATMAASSRSSLLPRTPESVPGPRAVYLYIYKDGGTRTFSRRDVGSD